MSDKNSIQFVSTPQAPAAVGPYSQGIVAGNLVFVSGQLPLNPETGQTIRGSIEERTDQVLKNLRAVLRAAGSNLSHVVKTTIFLIDMGDFTAVNEVYVRYFGSHLPARSVVQVASLPKGADIELEAIAVCPLS